MSPYDVGDVLARLELKLDKLQENIVPRSEHLLRDREVNNRFDRMELKLDETIRSLQVEVHLLDNRIAATENRVETLPDRVTALESDRSERDGVSKFKQFIVPLVFTAAGLALSYLLGHS